MIDEGLLFRAAPFCTMSPEERCFEGTQFPMKKNSLLIKQGTGSEHVFMLFQQGLTSHTYIFLVPPFTFTLTDFTLELHILLDFLLE